MDSFEREQWAKQRKKNEEQRSYYSCARVRVPKLHILKFTFDDKNFINSNFSIVNFFILSRAHCIRWCLRVYINIKWISLNRFFSLSFLSSVWLFSVNKHIHLHDACLYIFYSIFFSYFFIFRCLSFSFQFLGLTFGYQKTNVSTVLKSCLEYAMSRHTNFLPGEAGFLLKLLQEVCLL